jgi:hypothetical protein
MSDLITRLESVMDFFEGLKMRDDAAVVAEAILTLRGNAEEIQRLNDVLSSAAGDVRDTLDALLTMRGEIETATQPLSEASGSLRSEAP